MKIKLEDLSKLDSVVQLLSSSSYTELHDLNYDLNDKEKAQLVVYKKATKNAITKAKAIISVIPDTKLTKVFHIKDAEYKYFKPQPMLERSSLRLLTHDKFAQSSEANSALPQNEIEVSAQVYMSFELEQAAQQI